MARRKRKRGGMSTGRKWIRRAVSWGGKGVAAFIFLEPVVTAVTHSQDPAVVADTVRYQYTGLRSDGSLDQGQAIKSVTRAVVAIALAWGAGQVARRF